MSNEHQITMVDDSALQMEVFFEQVSLEAMSECNDFH